MHDSGFRGNTAVRKHDHLGPANFTSYARGLVLLAAGCLPLTVVHAESTVFSTGSYHGVAVRSTGAVWSWGNNGDGQLGDGTTDSSLSPVSTVGVGGVVAVSAGANFTLALRSNGTVWAWGNNEWGTLGDGTTVSSNLPVQVAGLTNIVAISAGPSHCVALRSDGTVWAWGDNSGGQLGNGGVSTMEATPVQMPGLTEVTQISAGWWMTMALRSDGTVWVCGNNSSGQIGLGTGTASSPYMLPNGLAGVVKISAGSFQSVALKADGTVWTTGRNVYGQLGDGTNIMRYTPVQVSGLSGVTNISSGADSTYALKSNGTVWGWGSNSSGQLGNGTLANQTLPVQVGGFTDVREISGRGANVLMGRTDGTVWAFGANSQGQLGNGTGTGTGTGAAVKVSGLSGISGDTDGDGVPNAQDAAPTNAMVDWVKAPERTYEWIAIPDAPAGYEAVDMNNHGHILFRRTDYGAEMDTWPSNLQVFPIGKVCYPTISGPGRWRDIFFKPAPFNLRIYDYETDEVRLHSIPLPMFRLAPDTYGATHGLDYVNLAGLGDDGGLVANVRYCYSYFDGHPENQKIGSSPHSTYVFKWSAADYATCYLQGDDRGYQGDTNSWSVNWAAGFQTLPGAGPSDPPVVRAAIFDEIVPLETTALTSASLIQAPFVGAGVGNTVQTNRRASLDFTGFNVQLPYAEFTHKGRVMLFKDYVAPDFIYTVGLAGTGGFTTVNGVPWSIFEIPTGRGGANRWGMTLNNVNHLITGSSAISMGLVGILQFDDKGTGISARTTPLQDIWRNGTWRTLGGMTTNASFIPGSLSLKKIGRTGVIWASSPTVVGIFRPNPL